MQIVLTPDLVLQAYRLGLFPMAYSVVSKSVHWVCPDMRGQLSINDMHIPKKLKRQVRKYAYDVKINTDFEGVIKACAACDKARPDSWINQDIIDVFCDLHKRGFAHSVEVWDEDQLVGGLYGLALGKLFCGESMFSIATNSSKIALVHLVARLHAGGFQVLDTQFVNDHLQQFGVYEVPHETYEARLKHITEQPADFILQGISEAELIDSYFVFRADQQVAQG